MHIARIILSFALLVTGAAIAQADPASEATRSVTYEVSPVDGSDISGTVFVGEYGPSTTIAVVSLDGTSAGDTHPAHFHQGDCGSGGGIQVPLSAVDGATGMSVTLTDVPFGSIVESDLYLNVHRSPEQMQTIVACGEAGPGVQPLRQTTASGADGEPRDEAAEAEPTTDRSEPEATQSSESAAPDTASYGLFAVQGSEIRGQVQLTELLGEGTKFVVSLVGIEPGSDYGLALYEGDCGPDRPKVRDLEPVGEREDDPYVSITDTELPFSTISEGDYFLYVFHGQEGDEVAACGEVGVGANR